MAAPPKNRNGIRHGLRGSQLPKGCSGIARAMSIFRGIVEKAVLATKGEITLMDAATINSAYRWERHAALCERWLREKDLSHADKLAFSREIARASSERDRCLRLLNLEGNQSITNALYGVPARLSTSSEEETSGNSGAPKNDSQGATEADQ